MNTKIKIGFVAASLMLASAAKAQLFTYTFADVTTATTASGGSLGGVASNLTFSNFTASGVANNANASGVFSFLTWTTGATTGSDTFTGAIDLTDYYEVTITPDSGYGFSLSSITFDAGRTSTGPRQFVVRSSVDGFSSNLTASESQANVSVVGENVFQFTDNSSTTIYSGMSVTPSSSVVSTAITFRIYAFNAEAAGGGFRIDNFVINGAVSAVPEPAAYATIAGALALIGVVIHRRRRAVVKAV